MSFSLHCLIFSLSFFLGKFKLFFLINVYPKVIQAKIVKEEEAKKAAEEAERLARLEEEKILNAVYEEKPLIAKPYTSTTSIYPIFLDKSS